MTTTKPPFLLQDPDNTDPAQALRVFPRWVWAAGVRTDHGERVVSFDGELVLADETGWANCQAPWCGASVAAPQVTRLYGYEAPDLNDPATVGCVSALARSLWDDPTLHLSPVRRGNPSQIVWVPATLDILVAGRLVDIFPEDYACEDPGALWAWLVLACPGTPDTDPS